MQLEIKLNPAEITLTSKPPYLNLYLKTKLLETRVFSTKTLKIHKIQLYIKNKNTTIPLHKQSQKYKMKQNINVSEGIKTTIKLKKIIVCPLQKKLMLEIQKQIFKV